ncbi:MAG: family 20 glycosylhydrolase [Carboxylicivirga sp.]|jgi:hexosaminidase|nr:family 20 glycosylhydrolase [Carboxylicivirga sp.]
MKLVYLKSSFFLLLMIVACGPKKRPVYNEGINITPVPSQVINGQGTFELKSSTKLFASSQELSGVINGLKSQLRASTGYDLPISAQFEKSNSINISINPSISDNYEAYELTVNNNHIAIVGASKEGAFYGVQSLLQLFPAEIASKEVINNIDWLVPSVEIKDEPRFKWRGMHLDVCRHYVPVENIKKHLDVMAMYKMNKFHWHLTEDQGWRIEIKKYPLLTEVGSKRIEADGTEYGGIYTQEQIKEIVAYASERMIDVVPEIELPGHGLGALTAYPYLSCTRGPFKVRNYWGVEPDVFCAGKESAFIFLEDVIDEVVELFPSPYFHIGGDECPKIRWEKCPHCQKRIKDEGLKDEHELQSYFIKRIEKILLAHGKKMIGWDEILEGGLAESAVVMSWRGEEGGIEAATHGHDVVMTPGDWCYLDHYQGDSNVEPVAIGGYTTLEDTYGYEPVPEELDHKMVHHILGTQGNVWTEYMYTPEIVEYRVYPRIIALAEVNWSTKENRDFESFVKRMDNQFVRLDMNAINYHIPLPEGPCNHVVFTDSVKLEFTSTRPIKIVYTTDNSEPTLASEEYTEPLSFKENTTLKITSVLVSGKMGTVRTINIEKQALKPALDVKTTTNNALKQQRVDGTFVRVAQLENVTNWEEGVSDLSSKPAYEDESVKTTEAKILTGYIEIPEDGVYEFNTNLDQFYIDGELLINNDGLVKRFSRNNSTIALAKGKHAVKLIYMENNLGGWPQAWNGLEVNYRLYGTENFEKIAKEMYSF